MLLLLLEGLDSRFLLCFWKSYHMLLLIFHLLSRFSSCWVLWICHLQSDSHDSFQVVLDIAQCCMLSRLQLVLCMLTVDLLITYWLSWVSHLLGLGLTMLNCLKVSAFKQSSLLRGSNQRKHSRRKMVFGCPVFRLTLYLALFYVLETINPAAVLFIANYKPFFIFTALKIYIKLSM